MHEPRELLSDGHQRFLDAGSEIQLASWEAADPGQDGSATSAATDPIGADPLSRIEWPESDTGVDAGATLRGLAEGAGLVLAIAVVGLWALRQWLVKRSTIPGAGRNLQRIDSLSLPQRCHVHLLDVQGRRVLVAIDPGGLKGVTVLPDSFDSLIESPPDDTTPADDDAPRGVPSFAATTLA
jgi:flagellar biogenesis protein FliO